MKTATYSRRRNEQIEARRNRAADLAEEKSSFSSQPQPRTKKGKIAKAIAETENMIASLKAGIERSAAAGNEEYADVQNGWLETQEAELARLTQ